MNEQIFELVGRIFETRRATAEAPAPAGTTETAGHDGSVAARKSDPAEASQPAVAVAPRKRPGARSRVPAR